jgi:hypothetical protein
MRTFTLLVLSSAAFAQTGQTGMITGKIADEFGIPVSGASIHVKDAAGKEFKATSTAAGDYTIDKLPPGAYEVTVTALAMKNFVQKYLPVDGTEPSRLDIKLQQATLGTLGEDDRLIIAVRGRIGSTPPSGPVPRLTDGKPDLSGFWVQPRAGGPPQATGPEQAEALPWAEEIQRERRASLMRDISTSRCLPFSITSRSRGKFVHTPSLLVILDSEEPPRQIFLDGREHPKDLNPTWQGDSVGHWEGDTLVVDSIGFNGLAWTADALPSTELLHVIERYHRTDLGHLEREITTEDPPVFRKPWTQKQIYNLDANEDIEENICTENNKDVEHMVGK